MSSIKVEPLSKQHDRERFDCGVKELNDFLKKYASQNQKKHISKTFVAVSEEDNCGPQKKEALGFYTLSTGEMDHSLLPSDIRHPKYPVSIARLARLAVDLKQQGNGVGGRLLYDALIKIRSASAAVGIFAVVVDAKDVGAKRFYEHYHFVPLEDSGLTLFLPMSVIEKL